MKESHFLERKKIKNEGKLIKHYKNVLTSSKYFSSLKTNKQTSFFNFKREIR